MTVDKHPVAALLLSLAALLSGCPKQTTTPDDANTVDAQDETEANPIIPAEPSRYAAGESLEATIPLLGGESLELASLRGRPVLLEISASWEVGWAEAHDFYAELEAEHAELEVIVISADGTDEALTALPAGLRAGWDPAGALAAKFSVATFPTMFVLDREGRIVAVVNGWSDTVRAEISESVSSVAAP